MSDKIEIERRTDEFNRLVETHNAEVERGLSRAASPSEKKQRLPGKLNRNVRNLSENSRGSRFRKPLAQTPWQLRTGWRQTFNKQSAASTPCGSLQNSEQNLKQRLNQTTVLLDQERRRNATLKGA